MKIELEPPLLRSGAIYRTYEEIFQLKKRIFSTFLLVAFLTGNFPPFVYAQEISNNIRTMLSSQGKALYGDESNSIMVIDYPENIERVAEYLAVLDVHPQQVLIEARVVEVKLQKEHSLGINWSAFAGKGGGEIGQFKIANAIKDTIAPTTTTEVIEGVTRSVTIPGGERLRLQNLKLDQSVPFKPTFFPPAQTASGQESPFTFGIFDDNINIILQALASALNTNVLSAPKVTTVNNREAEIKIIQKLPWAEPTLTETTGATGGTNVSVTWKVNFEELGIILKTTPTINEDGKITMVLNPEVSEKTSEITLRVSQGGTSIDYSVPIIDKRTASTKVVVGDGQTLIIGGMIKDKVTKGETKVPLLGDIPYLGYLFKSKKDVHDKTELLIFVSPTIITADELIKMSKEERVIWDKDYLKQRRKQQELTLGQEEEKEQEKAGLQTKLEMLTQRQKALVEERKSLAAEVSQEEQNLSRERF